MKMNETKNVINYQDGDLFAHLPREGRIIIPHVVNSVGAWGSGFVIPLGKHFPRAKADYLAWAKETGDDSKLALGRTRYSVTVEPGEPSLQTIVAHLCAQEGLPSQQRPIALRYDALETCMNDVGRKAILFNAQIVAPMFGAGLAGGSWGTIEEMINDLWISKDIPVTVFRFGEEKS